MDNSNTNDINVTDIWTKLKEMPREAILIIAIVAVIIICLLVLIRVKKKTTSGKGKIIGFKGQYAGKVIPIMPDETLVLGRDSAFSHIVFDHENIKISRRHCSVKYNASSRTYTVIDMSSNGTFVKQQRITPNQEVIVPTGTLISIGSDENIIRLT